MQKPETTHHYSNSRESIRSINHETLVDMFLALDTKFQQLADYVRDVVTQRYGQKNERFQSPGQLLIFPGADVRAGSSPQPSTPTPEAEKPQPKKPGHGRNPLPDFLPRVPIVAPPPADTTLPCPCCNTIRVPDRQLIQNSRYQFVPASFYIEDLYSVVYVCPNGHDSQQLIAKVSEAVENGIAGSGLLAQVAVARDFDHQPFNRQSAIYSRSGVHLPRSTLADFYAHLAEILLPLYTLMHKILLNSRIISTDDTPVKVLDRSVSLSSRL